MSQQRPRPLDAVAYAFLANLIWVPLDTPMKRYAVSRLNLEAYCLRMKARCCP